MPTEAEEGAQGADGAEEAAEPESTKAADERKKPATGASKKVTIRKSVADRIKLFNVSGELKKELRLSVVALALSKLEEQAALDVLDALLEGSDDIEDPNAFVCKRAREVAKEKAAELAAQAAAEEAQEEGEWEEDGEAAEEGDEGAPKKKKKKKKAKAEGEEEEEDEGPEGTIKRRVKTLNETEALWEPIRYKRLEVVVPLVGFKEFLPILDKLEAKAEDIGNPTAYLRKEAMKRLGPVLTRCDQLNRSVPGKMDLLEALDLAQVKEPLSKIPDSTAFRILKELEDKVFDIKDPTSWVIEEAKKKTPSGPLVDRINQLNASGRLQQQIDVPRAMDVLSAIDEQKGLWILTTLGQRAERIRNPIGWMAAEVRVREQAVAAAAKAAALPPPKAVGLVPAKARGLAVPTAAPGVHGAAGGGRVAPTTPPKRPPPRPPSGPPPGMAAKRPRTEAPAAAAEEEQGEGEDAVGAEGMEEAAGDEEEAEACLYDDADGEDPDAIG